MSNNILQSQFDATNWNCIYFTTIIIQDSNKEKGNCKLIRRTSSLLRSIINGTIQEVKGLVKLTFKQIGNTFHHLTIFAPGSSLHFLLRCIWLLRWVEVVPIELYWFTILELEVLCGFFGFSVHDEKVTGIATSSFVSFVQEF